MDVDQWVSPEDSCLPCARVASLECIWSRDITSPWQVVSMACWRDCQLKPTEMFDRAFRGIWIPSRCCFHSVWVAGRHTAVSVTHVSPSPFFILLSGHLGSSSSTWGHSSFHNSKMRIFSFTVRILFLVFQAKGCLLPKFKYKLPRGLTSNHHLLLLHRVTLITEPLCVPFRIKPAGLSMGFGEQPGTL